MILYIGGFEMPDRNAAAQRVIGNAKAFRDLEYDTYFIGLSKKKDLCNVIDEYEGFKYINLNYPESSRDWISYLTSIKQYNKYLEKQPDIIIAYNFPSISLNKLHKYCINKDIKLIADCTEWYEAKGNLVFRLLKTLDTWLRMKKVHPKMDGMIAISDYLYNYYNPRMRNVENIPPLVDLAMQKWKQENVEDILNSEKVNIIYAGSPGKGDKDRLDLIIEALSQVKKDGITNFQFNIIGITKEQYLSIFDTNIPDNLNFNVSFKGRLSHYETIGKIKNSHFYLFIRDDNLTNRAGFPTKFSESISCGTPIITNSSSNIKQYITNAENGFIITNFSIEELKHLLEKIITLPKSQIEFMKKKCCQSQRFDYRNYLSKFENLINKL